MTIVACFVGDELVGGAAFELDRWGPGPARSSGCAASARACSLPTTWTWSPTPGHHLAVAREVLGWLRRPGSRVVDLDGLAADGSLATMLAPYEVDRVAAPFANLTCGVQDYLAGRPGKVRSTITRTTKRFARDGVELVTVGSDGIDAALDDLARLHDQRWADGSVFLQGWERFCTAARAGATTGDVVVHTLRDADGEAVAVELDLVLGDTVDRLLPGRPTHRTRVAGVRIGAARPHHRGCGRRGHQRVRPAARGRAVQGRVGDGSP